LVIISLPVAPEGRLLYQLEKIIGLYFTSEERTPQEKNQAMIEGIGKYWK
jgi:hypothetical protein